jgi:hypothetical protein
VVSQRAGARTPEIVYRRRSLDWWGVLLHDIHELLMIALCAVLGSGQGTADMALFAKAKEPFLRSFLKLENGLPSRRRSAGSSVSSIRRSSKQPFSGSWQEFLFNVRP